MSESNFLLLIKAWKMYKFNYFTTVHNADGLDCAIQIVLNQHSTTCDTHTIPTTLKML
jgi:hypothetical protein